MDAIIQFLGMDNANLRYVLIGTVLIGATGGLLGTFAVLRKRSLLGDALAHSALPGVALAFLITGSKSLIPLLIGASASGILGVLIIQWITTHSKIKADAALGIVLTVFFGIGIVLLTYIQQSPHGNQSGLENFLFGQAASLVSDDLKIMTILMSIIIIAVLLFYKEFKLLIFDEDFLQSSGFPAKTVDLILMGLIVLTIMTGLQAVGVILVAAMLITPAAAARFWTNRLNTMLMLAVVFGIFSGIIGTYISATASKIPTGPVLVLSITFIFLISAILAPKRGIIARWRKQRQNYIREHIQHVLRAYFELDEQKTHSGVITLRSISDHLRIPLNKTRQMAVKMQKNGLLTIDGKQIFLTANGEAEALFVIKSHRLWEHYLLFRSLLNEDHVHQPADEIEHILTPEILGKLENLLQQQGIDTDSVINLKVVK